MVVRSPFLAGILLCAVLLAGCQTVHEVTIDAISDRNKPLGASYRLEVNDPTGGVEPELQALAVAAIKDALAARGLYEAPAGTRPDMVIEANYGTGHGHIKIVTSHNSEVLLGGTLLPSPTSKAVVVYDKTLELTARAPAEPDASGKLRPGPELWNVRAKIVDTKQELARYLPSLASACIDYIGENPGRELVLPIEEGHARVLLQQRPAAAPGAPDAQNR